MNEKHYRLLQKISGIRGICEVMSGVQDLTADPEAVARAFSGMAIYLEEIREETERLFMNDENSI